MLEIRFGLFCLRWKIGLVFLTCGSPRPEIGLGLCYLQFPPVSKTGRTVSKKTSILSKRREVLSRSYAAFQLTSIRKKRAHKLKKNPGTLPWDTQQDKQGSIGRCPRDFLLFTSISLPLPTSCNTIFFARLKLETL